MISCFLAETGFPVDSPAFQDYNRSNTIIKGGDCTGKIVAIGGGENGRGEHPYETGPFDREIVRLTGKDDPNFLFIGLANSFADSYYATMCDIFHDRLWCTRSGCTSVCRVK